MIAVPPLIAVVQICCQISLQNGHKVTGGVPFGSEVAKFFKGRRVDGVTALVFDIPNGAVVEVVEASHFRLVPEQAGGVVADFVAQFLGKKKQLKLKRVNAKIQV